MPTRPYLITVPSGSLLFSTLLVTELYHDLAVHARILPIIDGFKRGRAPWQQQEPPPPLRSSQEEVRHLPED